MMELLKEVQVAEMNEYFRAAEKFGLVNHSAHESYAVIREEMEEAEDEAATFQKQFAVFWDFVKGNSDADQKEALFKMNCAAELAAAEWIQVAAMCRKAIKTLKICEPEKSGESEN